MVTCAGHGGPAACTLRRTEGPGETGPQWSGRASRASPAKGPESKSQQSVSSEEDEDVMFFKAGKDKDPQSSSAPRSGPPPSAPGRQTSGWDPR